jgi:hypothetical protein
VNRADAMRQGFADIYGGEPLPANAGHWGKCRKCRKTGWVHTSDDLCLEGKRCHWKARGEV